MVPVSCLLTYTTEKIPLYRFVLTPNRYFSMEVKTCTAAAVVNPRTRGSVRQMATNPNLQTPRQNCFFFFLMTKRQIDQMIDQEVKTNRKHTKVLSRPLSNTANLYLKQLSSCRLHSHWLHSKQQKVWSGLGSQRALGTLPVPQNWGHVQSMSLPVPSKQIRDTLFPLLTNSSSFSYFLESPKPTEACQFLISINLSKLCIRNGIAENYKP